MKKQLLTVFVLSAAALLIIFRAPGRGLVDMVSQSAPAGFSVEWPALRYALEPFSGTAEYLLSFTRYMLQLDSWMFWLLLFAFVMGLNKKDTLKQSLKRAFRFEVYFLSIIMFCLVLPFPAPVLKVPGDFLAVDFHSHTFYSHDGLVSPAESLYYHRRLGFDSFFVTEHGHVNSFDKFPADKKLKTVYPGMQVSTTERVSLLVLADRQFDAAPYLHKSAKDVIELAHKNGFAVVCPHWWKWRYFSWQQLYDFGIDGFEVYNAGYRKFSREERGRLVDFCREKGLLMTGSTDWHGWGYLSNVWTVLEKTGDSGTFPFDALRKHAVTKVIVLERPGEVNNTLRYVLEPFFGLYYYFGSLNGKQAFYWLAWVALFITAKRTGLIKTLMPFMSIVLCAVFAGLAVCSIVIWIPLLPENQVLGKLLAPVFFGISAGWFLVIKYHNK